MKVLLVGVNAKYIHTSLSIRALAAYAGHPGVFMKEYTINEQLSAVVADIYREKPQVACFSCYIWNIEFICKIVSDLKKILPECLIVCGGSEVSFDSADFLMQNPAVDAVIRGEGEQSFRALCLNGFVFSDVRGVTYREKGGAILANEDAYPLCDMNELPFPYTEEDLQENHGKLIYYEASRGCPFGCSYCLSSVSRRVRFRSLEKVKKELLFFCNHKVSIVKLTDRTFNADPARTKELLGFLIDHCGGTTFHFEVAADLLTEEIIALLEQAPKGLFQLEIGVQSTNPDTIKAIDRKTDFQKISDVVKRLKRSGNIHMHLDLIAGLPCEDMKSFERSFNDVFSLRPHMLQLGFLKLLKGTKIREQEKAYDYCYTQRPPYEVLSCKSLSYDDILILKSVENVLEKYYNSGAFENALTYLLQGLESPFLFFRELSAYFIRRGYDKIGVSKTQLYGILCDFAQQRGTQEIFYDALKLDFLLHNKPHTPSWSLVPYHQGIHKKRFSYIEAHREKLIAYYGDVRPKDMIKNIHFEQFSYDVTGNGEKKAHVLMFDMRTSRLLGKAEDWEVETAGEIEKNSPCLTTKL